MAKQMVTAGLKWPPETGAQVMMANAMPRAKAQPIWKMEPKTGTPSSLPAAEVVERVKDATEAIPGKLKVDVSFYMRIGCTAGFKRLKLAVSGL